MLFITMVATTRSLCQEENLSRPPKEGIYVMAKFGVFVSCLSPFKLSVYVDVAGILFELRKVTKYVP